MSPPASKSPKGKKTKKARIERRKVSEALLADRLGLYDEWVERWQQGSKCVEESLVPSNLPQFVRKRTPAEIMDVERNVKRLVAAGCRRPVLYFCVEELSPEAPAIRAGRRRRSVPGKDGEYGLLAVREEERPHATREDMEAVRNKARLIHRHQRELLLVGDTREVPLPSGIMTVPENADDALSLLKESLTCQGKVESSAFRFLAGNRRRP